MIYPINSNKRKIRESNKVEKYKGYFILKDIAGDGYNVYDADKNIEEEGCASIVDAKKLIDSLTECTTTVKESFNDFLNQVRIKSLDTSDSLEFVEADPIPNTVSLKATYTSGENSGKTRIFVLADTAGENYVKSKGFAPDDLPTECLVINGNDGCFFITDKDFDEYRRALQNHEINENLNEGLSLNDILQRAKEDLESK